MGSACSRRTVGREPLSIVDARSTTQFTKQDTLEQEFDTVQYKFEGCSAAKQEILVKKETDSQNENNSKMTDRNPLEDSAILSTNFSQNPNEFSHNYQLIKIQPVANSTKALHKSDINVKTKSLEDLKRVTAVSYEKYYDGDSLVVLKIIEFEKESLMNLDLSQLYDLEISNPLNDEMTALELLDYIFTHARIQRIKLSGNLSDHFLDKLTDLILLAKVSCFNLILFNEDANTALRVVAIKLSDYSELKELSLQHIPESGDYSQPLYNQIMNEIKNLLLEHTQIEKLTLELAATNFEPIKTGVENLANLRELCLTANGEHLKFNNVVTICKLIKNLSNLESLTIRIPAVEFLKPHFKTITESFASLLKLNKLHLGFGFTSLGYGILESAFVNMNKLEELTIGTELGQIEDQDASELMIAIGKLEALKKLKVNLSSSEFSGRTCNAIAVNLSKLQTLEDLDVSFRGSFSSDNQGIMVMRSFGDLQNLKQLKININDCAHIADGSLQSLAASLKSLKFLNTLKIFCAYSGTFSVKSFSKFIENIACLTLLTTLTLDFGDTGYHGEENFLQLANVLEKTEYLENFEMICSHAKCPLTQKSFLAVCESLKNLKRLKTIYFEYNTALLSKEMVKNWISKFADIPDVYMTQLHDTHDITVEEMC